MEKLLKRLSKQVEALTIVISQAGVQIGHSGDLSKMENEAEEADRARTYGESNLKLLYKKLGIEPLTDDIEDSGSLDAS